MNRVTATYEIESPAGIARGAEVLASEQSTGAFAKVPLETDDLRARHGARIEELTVTGTSETPALPCRARGGIYERGLVRISWPIENFGTSLPTLLSTIAGNLFELAELSAVRLVDLCLPLDFAATNPGPQFGVGGTRRVLGGHEGPLIGTIVKPCVGLSPDDTASLVKCLAEAGIDFIKDDELQANAPHCPLPARVAAVMKVLNNHEERTGKRVMYAFNITDEIDQMWRNLDLLQNHGANCAMVCVTSVGLSGLRALRERSPYVIHGHRAGWGLYSRSPDIGISFPVWQKLWRLAGADHLHVNGLGSKFTETDQVVAQSARSVQAPVFETGGPAFAAMPVFSSAQTVWQIEPARSLLGNDDFIFCAGGGIQGHPDGPAAGVIALRQAAEAARDGIPIERHAASHKQLRAAMEAFKRPALADLTDRD
ncbi:ribulose-bisphosphate carboxylase large subunit family protein [Phaeobacter sp. B1627]|uniref:ribulose-bisphosphate carboxylase large subunit family protein n=1 Tax=Phaeobacter sp. B1627 TaxID=2583809 RepID=UPI0011181A09|nr:ribulose-bisphosphate carboxylase large subunit family protein [Phaeobacter sp. B1627]TNJ39945.1 ribulose 1,5-bisphosphate carboxylase [Phaeobacter sp. B1627]